MNVAMAAARPKLGPIATGSTGRSSASPIAPSRARSIASSLPARSRDRSSRRRRILPRSGARAWRSGPARCAVAPPDGDASRAIDSRSVCLARETLAYHDGLADFAFAMQGLGSGAVEIAGSDEQRRPRAAKGPRAASGSPPSRSRKRRLAPMSRRWPARRARTETDIAWMARRPGSRTAGSPTSTPCSPAPAKRRARAASLPSSFFPRSWFLEIAERIDVMAPHPLATLRFAAAVCRPTRRLGGPGEGFKIAMRTLDIFRASVAAAALGFARRAFERRSRMPSRGECSARRSRTCSSLRRRLATWRR